MDYGHRRELLANLKKRIETQGEDLSRLTQDLVAAREDGRIKLYVTHQALRSRREHPGLFADCAYTPLEAEGVRKDHAFAFARQKDRHWAVVVVPRLTTRLAPTADQLPLGAVWEGTTLRLPQSVRSWKNVFTGKQAATSDETALKELLAHFPLALLIGEAAKPSRLS